MGDRTMPVLDPERVPIVFVCGLHRSGTTLLTRLLGSSPGVHAMHHTGVPEDEGQHLQREFSPALDHGGPGAFAFDPAAHLTERSAIATSSTARRVLDSWTPHWHLDQDAELSYGGEPGQGVLLEKSPPNLIRARFLQALFPQARFVVLVRHPGVVAAATHRLCPDRSVVTALEHWRAAHAQYAADAASLHFVEQLRYEDLLTDPLGELRRLARALQLDPRFDASMIEASRSDGHHAAWQQALHQMPAARLERIDEASRAYGYSLREPFVLELPERECDRMGPA